MEPNILCQPRNGCCLFTFLKEALGSDRNVYLAVQIIRRGRGGGGKEDWGNKQVGDNGNEIAVYFSNEQWRSGFSLSVISHIKYEVHINHCCRDTLFGIRNTIWGHPYHTMLYEDTHNSRT